ncbi:MAG: DUF6199 family natural product biosynthesis protein [Bacillota bacterium]
MQHAKRFAMVLTVFMLAVALSSCQGRPAQKVYKVGKQAYALAVNESHGYTMLYRATSGDSTITATFESDPNRAPSGKRYRIDLDGKEYLLSGDYRQVELTFPDGRTIGKTYSGNTSSGHAGPTTQVSMDEWDLVDDFHTMLYPQPKPNSRSSGSPLIGLLLLGAGALSALNPRAAWFLNRGWMYRDAEPSDLYLGLSRVGGVVMAVIGLLIMVGGIG